ncbi:MAG TPA: sulfite exporter TauE/SafE family protein [Polyangiaceae bacterium]|nr:sulfite exporter TauE/SafE family protein [Polyangiaceae bacterium]
MDTVTFLSFAVSGLLVGTLVGATGVGGGSLMTPILVLLFGVNPATAVGTDLLFAGVTKSFGTLLHGLNRSVSWKVLGRLSLGSLPAAGITLWALRRFEDAQATAALMTHALGIALLITSTALLFQPWLQKLTKRGSSPDEAAPSAEDAELVARLEAEAEDRPGVAMRTVLLGAVLGALVTFTSVGAGALGVVVLVALYPKVRSVRIVGTDIAHAVPLTLLAGAGHASLGGVDYGMLGALICGSIPGVVLGSQLAFRVSERVLKGGLGAILFAVGSKLVF